MGNLPTLALELFALLLAPARCAACDANVPRRTAVFCSPCASTADVPLEDDPRATAAFVYGGAVARAIVRLKYERRPDLARPLGDLLWRALAPRASALTGAVVVPVPLHVTRLAERGFNQSALLGKRLAHQLGAPLLPMALTRSRDTSQQAILGREARLANVADAFRSRQPDRVRGRMVLLVDDVRTTGATLEACEQVLLAAGAAGVVSAVVARA